MGFDQLDPDEPKPKNIQRPICSNLMRKSNKVALKVESSSSFLIVHTKDIVNGNIGISLFKGFKVKDKA